MVSLLDGCLQSGVSQATSEQYSTLCNCLRSLHWSLTTDDSYAVTCHKGLRCGRPETRIKVKADAYQLLHNHNHQSTNLEKLIIPTDEILQPTAKSIHEQPSSAAITELSHLHQRRLFCYPYIFETVSQTFTVQW